MKKWGVKLTGVIYSRLTHCVSMLTLQGLFSNLRIHLSLSWQILEDITLAGLVLKTKITKKTQKQKIRTNRKKRGSVCLVSHTSLVGVWTSLNHPWFRSYLSNHVFQQYLKKKARLVLGDLLPWYGWQQWSDFFWMDLRCRVGNKESSFTKVKLQTGL